MEEEFKKIYEDIKEDINGRLKHFRSVWENGDDEAIFAELAFCLLTPQSKARNADIAIKKLLEDRRLYEAGAEDIKEELNIVRFKNRKADFIVLAREQFTKDGEIKIKDFIKSFEDDIERRNWFAKNVKGIGYKEAGHFIRNIGFYENIAILDRHILKNLVLLNVIDEFPKTLSPKTYLEIEKKMKKKSKEIEIKMEAFDLVLWYKEAGEVFK